MSLEALATDDLDPETQVLLGGDNGLRGYPIRYQAGESRAVLNVEQRFFTEFYPWRLFRVGWAVFGDIGKVSGRDPRATEPLGTLYDVGAGLRLSSPRASGRNVVHIDLAFPLNGPPTSTPCSSSSRRKARSSRAGRAGTDCRRCRARPATL